MEHLPKNQTELSQVQTHNETMQQIAELLKERQIVNGMEAEQILKFKPMDMDVDVVYLPTNQISAELWTEIADSFGNLMEPSMDKEFRDATKLSPRQLINQCLKAHGFADKIWSEGVIMISNRGSHVLKKIYAAEYTLLNAKRNGKQVLKDKGTKACVFVDADVCKKYDRTNTPQKEIVLPKEKSMAHIIRELEEEMVKLNEFTETFRYKSPNEVMANWHILAEKGDHIHLLVQAVAQEIERNQEETVAKIEALNEKVRQSRTTRDQVAIEMEHQMEKVQKESEKYQQQVKELRVKINTAEDANEFGSHSEEIRKLNDEMNTTRREYMKTNEENSFKTADVLNELNSCKFQSGMLQSKLFEAEEELMHIKRKRETVEKGKELHNGYLELKQTILKMSKAEDPEKRDHKEQKQPLPEYSSDESDDNQIVPTRGQPLITMAGTDSNTPLPRLASPSKFGMKMWTPLTSTIFQHLQSVKIGIQQAREQKLDDKQIQNLVLMTLPPEHQYVIDFITEPDRQSIEVFLNKIVELLEGSKTEQLSNFLKAQRKPNEKILGFFSRMKNLYIHSTTKKETELEADVFGIRLIYQKCYEAMAQVQRTELQRLADPEITQGTLKFSDLLKYVAQAARKIPIESVSLSALDTRKPSQNPKQEGSNNDRKCFYCNRIGHIKRYCYKRQNDEKRRNESNNKDQSTEGGKGEDEDGRPTNYQKA